MESWECDVFEGNCTQDIPKRVTNTLTLNVTRKQGGKGKRHKASHQSFIAGFIHRGKGKQADGGKLTRTESQTNKQDKSK